jgi:hypothetical protein
LSNFILLGLFGEGTSPTTSREDWAMRGLPQSGW